jgi:hypothetical protein
MICMHSYLQIIIKYKLSLPFYMEIMILAAWSIWIVRNNKIFKDHDSIFRSWKSIYYQEIRLVSYRSKRNMLTV